MRPSTRLAVLAPLVLLALSTGPGAAVAAPSCIGGSLTFKGFNDVVRADGLKNAGTVFSGAARADGGLGHILSEDTARLIAECRAG